MFAKAIAQVSFGGHSKVSGIAQSPKVIGKLPRKFTDGICVTGSRGSDGKWRIQTNKSRSLPVPYSCKEF
jgi:hypothetical protein